MAITSFRVASPEPRYHVPSDITLGLPESGEVLEAVQVGDTTMLAAPSLDMKLVPPSSFAMASFCVVDGPAGAVDFAPLPAEDRLEPRLLNSRAPPATRPATTSSPRREKSTIRPRCRGGSTRV
jgi:hypothetical protein